ncbi:MAG TPA: hydantoinase/oxoprolinase family protein [Amycolatopsis sp.]|nr:hydantoinase/oxoprolinase family protein [Amycolatopsis sp.]
MTDVVGADGGRRIRIGIDVGGTFTDIVGIGDDGTMTVIKVPSTPQTPNVAVIRAIEALLEREGDVGVDFLGHGTTAATNAFLTKRGSVTALLTTQGFEDVLEFRRMDRTGVLDPYDLQLQVPAPLVPARRRIGVAERIGRGGEVVTPLTEEEIARTVRRVRESGAEAVAISLLWSFANPAHEIALRDALIAEIPDLFVTCSHEIDPTMSEYERTSTTTVNAYVGPLINRYFSLVEQAAAAKGLPEPRIMQSNGGLASINEAGRRPVALLESGPAAGVAACAHLGNQLGVPNVLAVDMGGTSFDVALITGGEPRRLIETEVHGYAVRTPMLDIRSIGAGGGSIAWIDEGGALRVGPQSAGSEPGPVCYRRGGTLPTVSDANAVLGYIHALTGGSLELDVEAARKALAEQIGEPLGLDAIGAAHAVRRLANAHMADAMRVMTSEAAMSPADLTLMVYGGAGPLHGASLAREMEISRAVVPAHPGALSAMGVGTGDLIHELVEPIMKPLDVLEPAEVGVRFESMRQRGQKILEGEGRAPDDMEFQPYIVARYIGQMHDLQVSLSATDWQSMDLAALAEHFHNEHRRVHGISVPGEPVLMVSARLRVTGKIRKPSFAGYAGTEAPEPERTVTAWFEDIGSAEIPLYRRAPWRPHAVQAGPAIIQEYDSTIIVLPGQSWHIDEFGSIIIEER